MNDVCMVRWIRVGGGVQFEVLWQSCQQDKVFLFLILEAGFHLLVAKHGTFNPPPHPTPNTHTSFFFWAIIL